MDNYQTQTHVHTQGTHAHTLCLGPLRTVNVRERVTVSGRLDVTASLDLPDNDTSAVCPARSLRPETGCGSPLCKTPWQGRTGCWVNTLSLHKATALAIVYHTPSPHPWVTSVRELRPSKAGPRGTGPVRP
jgi:hypothetical protein